MWRLNGSVLREEVKFWTNPTLKGYPNLVKLIGYTWERDVQGIVYDLNPLDTLHNVIMKGINYFITSFDVNLSPSNVNGLGKFHIVGLLLLLNMFRYLPTLVHDNLSSTKSWGYFNNYFLVIEFLRYNRKRR